MLHLAACSVPSATLEVVPYAEDLTLHSGRQSLAFEVHNSGPVLSLLSWTTEPSELIITSPAQGVLRGETSARVEVTVDLSLYDGEELPLTFGAGEQSVQFQLKV